MLEKGKFIVFEGLDGCGKTTQLKLLQERMSTICRERKCFETREPSDSVPGLICRGISKESIFVEPETEALLYAADRNEHVLKELLPQLNRGNHVLCDRYYFSNFAYQTLSSDMERLLAYNQPAMERLRADVTIFIDVSPEECEKRRSLKRASKELYEKVEQAKIIRENYFAAFERLKDSERVEVINGEGSVSQIFENIWLRLVKDVFDQDDLL
ncbi:MAG: dTMP kinase [Clostridiales bacterium]|nr:dTMP kinase [Clostridiales bacterium]